MGKFEDEGKEGRPVEASDVSLLIFFALRKRLSEISAGDEDSLEGLHRRAERGELESNLIDAANLEEFLSTARREFAAQQNKETLRRAFSYMIPTSGDSSEGYFLKLFSALESALTFFRRENEYDILPPEEFSELERDLKKWLKQHPLLSNEPEKRSLIYEKVRELNRFPFSHVFKKFCERYDVHLDDLWPVTGRLDGWPLLEIRHRLVHGDPFRSRPQEALLCATEHLRWTAERMLLSVLGWPIERSNASPEHLARTEVTYRDWPGERARFA
jgi:hypothetical protein